MLVEPRGVIWNIFIKLKKGKSRGRDYLSIVSRYWDRDTNSARTRTIKSLDYVDDLRIDHEDPIGHF